MREREMRLAELRALVVEPEAPPSLTVFLLHGSGMRPEDLAPFAHSLAVHARFVVPQGPHAASGAGFGWWPIAEEARATARAGGARDLSQEHPLGLAAARRQLQAAIGDAGATWGVGTTVLGGFSQGGMLACDVALCGDQSLAALALLSASRLAVDTWTTRLFRVRELPVLVAHGRSDDDLSFAAGEALRDMLAEAGAQVTWVPHDDGHVIPLPVWRALRRFLRALADPASA
jgi:phospholipase/carboxylesterase